MTASKTMTTIPDQTGARADPVSSITPHLIEVTADDIETGLIPPKGLCAVLPAYNEELVIGSVILRTKQYVDRVIVVDDGSSDRTAEVARLAGAEVLRLDHNTGKAYTILLGLRHARRTGCKVAVMLDADGQHDPREIPRVANFVSIGKADLVIGSRFLTKQGAIPPYRQVGQKILDVFTNISAKTRVTDSQSGFRALSCQALDNLDFRSDGYNVESDMIAHFAAMGLSIEEVPISVNYDVPNKHKKHPVTHGVGVFARLINLIAYKRPLLLFGVMGAICISIGLIEGYTGFLDFSATSKFPSTMAMTSTMFVFIGVLLIISGLLLNTLLIIMTNTYKKN
jgi:glycosyltransferase involved in cell wall biosynthesis